MKTYTKIVFNWDGNVLEEESFEYHGPVDQCKGGTVVAAPEPTPVSDEEKDLIKKQTELVNQQISSLTKQNQLFENLWPTIESYYESSIRATSELLPLQTEAAKAATETAKLQAEATAELLPYQKEAAIASTEYSKLQTEAAKALLPLQQKLAEQGIDLNSLQLDAIKSQTERNAALEPVLLEAMGYAKDESGKYVAIDQELDPILSQFESRYTEALSGETSISPALEKQLQDEQSKLEADLSQRLGPNWKDTTPGIQALNEFQQRADLVREEARQSTIQSAGGQYLAARSLAGSEQQQKVSNLAGLMSGTTSLSNVPTGVSASSAGLSTPTYSAGLNTANVGGLMSGGSSASSNLPDLINYYSNQRSQRDQYNANNFALQAGSAAGRSSSLFGGLMGGASLGGSVATGTALGGPLGAVVGGAGGLLAGYLLS